MTTEHHAALEPETFRRRWMNRIAAFDAAMDIAYDEIQDRRLDRIEAELVRLRSELAAVSAPSRP